MMESVGHILKTAREDKQMSITDIADVVKTVSQVIKSIENDDFSVFPAPIYARGFIKLYAESVGLDPAPLLEIYKTHYAPETVKQHIVKKITAMKPEEPPIAPRQIQWKWPKINLSVFSRLPKIRLSKIHWPRIMIPKIPVNQFRLPVETWKKALSVIGIVLLVIIVCLLYHAVKKNKLVMPVDSRIQSPPPPLY